MSKHTFLTILIFLHGLLTYFLHTKLVKNFETKWHIVSKTQEDCPVPVCDEVPCPKCKELDCGPGRLDVNGNCVKLEGDWEKLDKWVRENKK